MEQLLIAGPLRVQLLEPTQEMPDGGRKLIIQPNPYSIVEIPIPKDLVQRIGADLLLDDDDFLRQAQEEAERAAASEKLIVPGNGAAPA